jgi:hypothetical protein
MDYTHNLIITPLPAWVEISGVLYQPEALTADQLSEQGWLSLIYDPEGEPLGYAAPVAETRAGVLVAVAYALGTVAERLAAKARALQKEKNQETKDLVQRAQTTINELLGLSDTSDDLLGNAVRSMVRAIVNKLATDAGLSANVTNAEAKAAAIAADPIWDRLDQTGRAQKAMKQEIAALTDAVIAGTATLEDLVRYSVTVAALIRLVPELGLWLNEADM